MKRFLLSAAACIAIVGVGAGVAVVGMAIRSSSSDAKGVSVKKKPLNVEVRVLETSRVEDRLDLIGSLEPWQDVTLSAGTMGEIEWQGIEEGERVEAGQELLRVDTVATKIRLEQARAQYELAVAELKRNNEMRDEGISSPRDRDRAVVDRQVALANLRATEIELEHSLIKAKFAGIVDVLHQEEGEYVSRGTPLVRLVQVDKVKLVVGMPERDVPHFAPGDTVEVTLDAFPEEVLEGTVFRMATTAEASTHTFLAEIELANDDGLLKPGMIAKAHLVRQVFPEAITVPLFSVITTDSGLHVFLEEAARARMRPIEIGFIQGENVHVTRGLAAGDRLIVVGHRDLREDDILKVQRPHE